VIYEKLNLADFEQLTGLEQQYKMAIGEPQLTFEQIAALKRAIEAGKIEFFVAKDGAEMVGMCSVTVAFSTFACSAMGIFEDFFIANTHRKQGIAGALTQFVFAEMKARGITSLWVGSADIDVEMYKSLGFDIPLGNLLAWGV
jgi:GNAT superfamily N-acetyltransferase